MSVIDIVFKRRGASGSPFGHTYQPHIEVLEERQCLSLAAPTGLQLTAISATQVKVSWNDVAGELGFRVYDWNGTTISQVGQVAKGVTTFSAGNLPPDQTLYFAVEAFNNSTSARSAWSAVTTPADPITAPTNVQVGSATLTQLTVSWKPATGQTGYSIFEWNGAQANQVGTANASATSFTVGNLTPGTFYYFYVQAYNATNSASSDWASGATLGYTITAPANVKTQAITAAAIGLSWSQVTAATGYRVYQWNGSALSSAVVVATLPGAATSFQATGLMPGTAYWFYVQAYNATNSADSAWVTATTLGELRLQPPTQLTATADGHNSVALSWTDPSDADGYRVYVWTGASWSQVSTLPAGTHQAIVTGLAANQTHWFMVQTFTAGFAEVTDSQEVFANL